jgi:hypothetical protein
MAGSPAVSLAMQERKSAEQIIDNALRSDGSLNTHKQQPKSNITVRIVDSFVPEDNFSDAVVTLMHEGVAIATGKGTTTFSGLPFGVYSVEVRRRGSYAKRNVIVLRPQEWVTVELILPGREQSYPVMRVTGRVDVKVKKQGELWTKLVGLYSEFIQESSIDTSGEFEFVVPPGIYVLFAISGSQVLCGTQQIDVKYGIKPILLHIPATCYQSK